MKPSSPTPIPFPAGLPFMLELLEQRIAPAGLADIEYKAVTLGNPQLLKAGEGLATADGSGAYLLAVEKGSAMIFTTDLNGNNVFDVNEITGIAAGDGLRMTIFTNVNGDIVTNLLPNGFLSDSDLDPSNDNPLLGGDGRVLLNSRIEAITLRSVTNDDIPLPLQEQGITAATRLALSSYSIHGNILAGGGIGVPGVGDDGMPRGGVRVDTSGLEAQLAKFNSTASNYQLEQLLPVLGGVRTGTAAAPLPTPDAPNGMFFNFGYQTTGPDAVRGSLVTGGYLLSYLPQIGQDGGDIIGLTSGILNPLNGTYDSLSPLRIDAIMTGDGGPGARGGNIENVVLFGDSGGLRIIAGDGGAGPAGGAGGSIVNLQDLGSTNSVVQIRTGDGGAGFLGAAGAAGALSFGRFEMNGEIYVGLGSGGAGFTSSGSGTSLDSASLRPTAANGTDSSVAVVSSFREIGDISSVRLADFNGDGLTDLIMLTRNPDQIIMKFGTPAGITDDTPTLYFAAPAFAPITGAGARTAALVVGDFNGDGWLDFAVGSSATNSYEGIRTYLNPGNAYRPDLVPSPVQPLYNGWYTERFAETAALRPDGGNYIDSYITSPIPFLNPYSAGVVIQRSGMPLTDMVAGNFDGDGDGVYDLALILEVWRAARIDADRAWTSLLMMTGTGDGRFFADFDYNRADDTQRKMPVLNGTSTGVNGVITGDGSAVFSKEHNDIALRGTAAPANAPGGANTEIIVGATLLYEDDRRVQTVQFSGVPGASLGALQAISREVPIYYSPNIVTGSIVSWSTERGTPVDITVTDIGGDGLFDIVVVNEQRSISMLTPLNQEVDPVTGLLIPAPVNSGIELTGQRGNNPRVGGIPPDATPGGSPDVRQPVQIGGDSVQFRAIVAGNFAVPDPLNPVTTSFSLLSTGTGATRDQFISFFLPGLLAGVNQGDQWANLVYRPEGTFSAASAFINDARLVSELVAFDLFAVLSSASVYGVAQAYPTLEQDGFRGILSVGPTRGGFVLVENMQNAIQLVAGNGGNSFFGPGGNGGSIGRGGIEPPVAPDTPPVGNFTIIIPGNPYVQPNVGLFAGAGGSGFSAGGAGGSMSSVVIAFLPGTNSAVFSLFAGAGGDALSGPGGAGGDLARMSIDRGVLFEAGVGGLGFTGGAGGSVLGGGGSTYGPDTTTPVVRTLAGEGGRGLAAGGAGGSIVSFVALFPQVIGGDTGLLQYRAGRGGDALSGAGGAGGSIRDASPSGTTNFLAGPLILTAGDGGFGARGGAGGGIINFTNPAGTDTPLSIASAVAGRGGAGVSGSGGAGGNISNFIVSGRGIETGVDGEFNRVIAGAGGASFGAIGGAGGNLDNVTSTGGNSAAVAVAGSGGAGLLRGGDGGNVRNTSVSAADKDVAAKVIVFAGHGGSAYAATATAPGVSLPVLGNPAARDSAAILALRAFGGANGIGGNGGNIIDFSQQTGTNTAVDLVAGNGGSLVNYGSIFVNSKTTVGLGGSLSGIQLTGEAGRTAPDTPIRAYGSGFVDRVLLNGWGTLLTDAQGNVGVVAGEAGRVKDGVAGDGPAKNGSVTNFQARSILSMVAGSVERIAAIKTISGVSVLSGGGGVYGAFKSNPEPHTPDTNLYFNREGGIVSSPVIGGRLMDGAIVTQANPGGLAGQRVFTRG